MNLKKRQFLSCRTWKDAGRQRNGPIHAKYRQDKLLYKKRIKEERAQETSSYTNDLHDALMHKSGSEFWKNWNSKFENKTSRIIQVGGTADSSAIINSFAKHFEQACSPFSAARNAELKAKYLEMRSNYSTIPLTGDVFPVELVESLVSKMKNGKAAGLDELTSEHLKHSHPILIVILRKLFNLFVLTGHIPNKFGASYTIPIPKCDTRTKGLNVDDFRGISISPVISKLFELCILERFSDYFESSDYQFGFKKQLSCCHLIYSVRSVIEQYISNSSTVNICTLDISKGFDKMNHYALFVKLMERKFPIELLVILENWFTMSITCVRWGGQDSYFFKLMAGVRQGGVLSPVLFAIFIDGIISKAMSANVGCYLSTVCFSIFLYADDILLLAPTVTGLQILLDICEQNLIDLDMRLNISKSHCMRFGARFDAPCANIISKQGGVLEWVNTCRYLGVYFLSGRVFRCQFHNAKCSFFRAFNAIFSKVGGFASEVVILCLLKSKCLPCLFYGIEACPVLKRDKHSFDFSLTRLFMKMFKTGSADVVAQCQVQFGFLPLSYQIDVRTAKFLFRFTHSSNFICSLLSNNAHNQLNNLFNDYSVTSVYELQMAINNLFFNS